MMQVSLFDYEEVMKDVYSRDVYSTEVYHYCGQLCVQCELGEHGISRYGSERPFVRGSQ